ncbi:hypothetical protein AAG570_007209 [Ranatra chinensis]|uniref:Large ribosomal subunit protein mL40 n=1 Tax=Ranatra chinensis TaxID=642074 RepID=A0ABD0XVH8_9HEMI
MSPGVFLYKRLTRLISTSVPLNFRTSQSLFAEPLKKKKRIDPAVTKAREERRRKRIEKQIRRLEKGTRQLKPIEECEIPLEIVKNNDRIRSRQEDSSRVIGLFKSWAAYKYKQSLRDATMVDRILYSQQLALDRLKMESPELYLSAVQVDESLLPFVTSGPTETPPVVGYDSPDGEYIDISKKWDD